MNLLTTANFPADRVEIDPMEAVKKQIATPVVGDVHDCCPNCGYIVERWVWGDSYSLGESGEYSDAGEYEMEYCCHCGQKLLWED